MLPDGLAADAALAFVLLVPMLAILAWGESQRREAVLKRPVAMRTSNAIEDGKARGNAGLWVTRSHIRQPENGLVRILECQTFLWKTWWTSATTPNTRSGKWRRPYWRDG